MQARAQDATALRSAANNDVALTMQRFCRRMGMLMAAAGVMAGSVSAREQKRDIWASINLCGNARHRRCAVSRRHSQAGWITSRIPPVHLFAQTTATGQLVTLDVVAQQQSCKGLSLHPSTPAVSSWQPQLHHTPSSPYNDIALCRGAADAAPPSAHAACSCYRPLGVIRFRSSPIVSRCAVLCQQRCSSNADSNGAEFPAVVATAPMASRRRSPGPPPQPGPLRPRLPLARPRRWHEDGVCTRRCIDLVGGIVARSRGICSALDH